MRYKGGETGEKKRGRRKVQFSRCQSKGAQGTGGGCTNRNGSRWGAGRRQVDLRRRYVESERRRQQIEDHAWSEVEGLSSSCAFASGVATPLAKRKEHGQPRTAPQLHECPG